MRYIIIFTIIIYTITSCKDVSISSVESVESSGMNNVDWETKNLEGFNISYPKDWTFEESNNLGLSFGIKSPKTDEEDEFRENVNLMIQDLSKNPMTLEEYSKLSESQVDQFFVNGKIIESKELEKEGSKYHKIIYLGNQNNRDLKFEQYYWIKENQAFVLTLTCEEDKFSEYQKMGEEILNSFEFK